MSQRKWELEIALDNIIDGKASCNQPLPQCSCRLFLKHNASTRQVLQYFIFSPVLSVFSLSMCPLWTLYFPFVCSNSFLLFPFQVPKSSSSYRLQLPSSTFSTVSNPFQEPFICWIPTWLRSLLPQTSGINHRLSRQEFPVYFGQPAITDSLTGSRSPLWDPSTVSHFYHSPKSLIRRSHNTSSRLTSSLVRHSSVRSSSTSQVTICFVCRFPITTSASKKTSIDWTDGSYRRNHRARPATVDLKTCVTAGIGSDMPWWWGSNFCECPLTQWRYGSFRSKKKKRSAAWANLEEKRGTVRIVSLIKQQTAQCQTLQSRTVCFGCLTQHLPYWKTNMGGKF